MMAELDILNGFAGKVISDCIDISINAIKKADKNRKSKNQTMETRIYQVTVDAIKAFTKREYKGQDVLYDVAESIIRGFMRNKNNKVEAVRMGLKMLGLQVTSETCKDFLKILQHEICIDENDILYKEICIIQGRQTFEAMCEGFDVSSKNDEETHKKLDYLIEKQNGKEIQGVKYLVKSPIVNRADEYAQRWSKNVFLNNFNKRDKNAGVNIKLQEIYPEKNLPHYKWKSDDEESADLKELLREYIVDNDEKKMLLILGQAGIGKSTLITWIMANLVEKKENILVYQFASDLGNVNWQDNNILDEIFATIDLGYNELEGKTLILDGFDEIYVKENRESILHKLNQELEKKIFFKTFSIIITCRENYVKKAGLEGIEYITLLAWYEDQIRSFCEVYEEAIISKFSDSMVNKNLEVKIGKIIEKKDIMGIPLILYMVLALNVDVERSSSTADIYDQVFSLKKGGIYDRGYDIEHRINAPEIKRHIHHISQKIAFWMFENNSNEAIVSQEKFVEICEDEMKELGKKGEDLQRDTLIGNFFQIKHCEGKGTDELQFVHRSIYEYFVAEYFYESIHRLASKEDIAGKLGELLKDGRLSGQILEFVKYKFDNIVEYSISEITKEVFNIMLRDGMTYHVGTSYRNVIEREMNIFINMLEVISLWNSVLEDFNCRLVVFLKCNRENCLKLRKINLGVLNNETQYILNEKLRKIGLKAEDLEKLKSFLVTAKSFSNYFRDVEFAETYLQMADYVKTYFNIGDLMGIYLREADLQGANLSGVDLQRADLQGADLREANLVAADLSSVNLKGVDLREANLAVANLTGVKLIGADLTGANLSGTDIVEADLRGARLSEANLRGANLYGANLGRTNLCGADLREANLNEIHFFEPCFNKVLLDEKQTDFLLEKYDLEGSRVYIFETEEIISYEEYCRRRQKK